MNNDTNPTTSATDFDAAWEPFAAATSAAVEADALVHHLDKACTATDDPAAFAAFSKALAFALTLQKACDGEVTRTAKVFNDLPDN